MCCKLIILETRFSNCKRSVDFLYYKYPVMNNAKLVFAES